MVVSDLMTTPVLTVKTDASIADLLELFKSNHVSGVPVVDENDHLVGIVSRQDIVLEELRLLGGSSPAQSTLDQIVSGGFVTVSGEGLKSRSQLVREIMTDAKNLLACREDTPVREACTLMVANHVHRLPVINGDKLVGILTTTDVVKAVAGGRV